MYHHQYYLLFYYYIITTYKIKGRTRERSPPSFESSSPFVLWPFLRMVALPVCDRTDILLVSFFVRLLPLSKGILCRTGSPSHVVYLHLQPHQSALSCRPSL